MSLPSQWKRHGRRGKQILLKAVGNRLPSELLHLPKKGFDVPLASWFRGPLREFLHDHLTSRGFLERGIVSEIFLRHMLDEHDSRRRNNHHWLWMLLVLELWFENCGRVRAEVAA